MRRTSDLKDLSSGLNELGKILRNRKFYRRVPLESIPSTSTQERQLRKQAHNHFQKTNGNTIDPVTYGRFLKSLYPIKSGLSTLSGEPFSRHQVIHSTLFEAYTHLPRPGVGQMDYNHMEDFMSAMFWDRNFSKPNSLSANTLVLYDDSSTVKQYIDGCLRRKAHLKILWQLAQDLEDAGIATTEKERREMIFKTFYRDRVEITHRISQLLQSRTVDESLRVTLKDVELPSFDWDTYQDILSRMKVSNVVESANVLLFCSLRHGNDRAVDDILKNLPVESYNRATYRILLECHSSGTDVQRLAQNLQQLCSVHPHFIDVTLLNVIVNSLVQLGMAEQAERLLSVFMGDMKLEVILPSDMSFLRLQTYQDKEQYRKMLAFYDSKDPSESEIPIFPIDQTFLPLLKHACTTPGSFERITEIIHYMEETWNIPISTKVFVHIFHSFATFNHKLDELQKYTAKLIELHDIHFSDEDYGNQYRFHTESPHVKGSFIKLSNAFMRQIFRAYTRTLENEPIRQRQVQMIQQKLDRSLALAMERHTKDRLFKLPKEHVDLLDICERMEMTYLKKCTLLELVEV